MLIFLCSYIANVKKVCEYIVILPQSHNNYPGTVPRFQICTVAFVGHVNGIYLQPNTIQLIINSETVKYSGYTNTPTLTTRSP